MKGYSEYRGQLSKLDFDPETKLFVSNPVEHPIHLEPTYFSPLKKLVGWLKCNKQTTALHETLHQLDRLTAEQRDDIGMTDFYTRLKP